MPHVKLKKRVHNAPVKLDFDYIREKLLQYTEIPFENRTRKSTRKQKPKTKHTQNNQELKNKKNLARSNLRVIQHATYKTSNNEESEKGHDKVYYPKIIPSILGKIIEKKYNEPVHLDDKQMPPEGFPVASRRDETEQSVNDTESFDKFDSIPFNALSKEEIYEEQLKLVSKPNDDFTVAEQETVTDESIPLISDHDENKSDPINSQSDKIKINNDESFWDNDIFTNIDVNNWMHFDTIETDKLEWMKNIEENKTVQPDEPYVARFNFKGYLLPYTMPCTEETRTLFHHGEESHRPGYSLSELFVLSQSEFPQQKAMALNTIAGILDYYSFRCIARNCRRHVTTTFRVKISTISFRTRTQQFRKKDFYIAEVDIFTVLIKSDIIKRFYYILETVRPSSNCVQYCLQIITRLARQNMSLVDKIIESEHLMKTIIKNFMPTTSLKSPYKTQHVYGKPFLPAVKLIRVLTIQSKENSEILVEKYEIIKPASEYISSNVNDNYGLRVQIESYSILTNLLHVGVGLGTITSLAPIIIGSFHNHVKRTDVIGNSSVLLATHASCVIQSVNKLVNCNTVNFNKFKHQVVPMVKEGLKKWIAQLLHADTYTAAMLRPISSALYFCKCIMLTMKAPLKFLGIPLKELSSCKIYKEIASKLVPCSNLLSGLQPKDFHTAKNLKTLCTTVIDSPDKVLPLLRKDSPFTFFSGIFSVLCLLEENDLVSVVVAKMAPYFKRLYTLKEPSLCSNWTTRIEIFFLFNFVITAFFKETKLNQEWLFTISHKLCYVLRKDEWSKLEFLFSYIIFSKKFMTPENVFDFMSITGVGNPNKTLNYFAEIKLRYKESYNFYIKFIKCKDLYWEQPIIPKEWLYLPISSLYEMKHSLNTGVDKVETIDESKIPSFVECNLRWILFIEKCYPQLTRNVDVTERFLRLMSIFLLGKSIFAKSVIRDLLRKCITLMFKRTNDFNFEKKFMGVYNFEDFYREILKQFQAAGTDDPTFVACVMVPVAQVHNVKWRRMLWSEFSSCLKSIKCPSELLHYNDNDYMFPLETDESLLNIYTRAITTFSLKSSTLTYTIAHHHIKSSLKKTSKTKAKKGNTAIQNESTDAP
ncbi:uncharacterized protein LOC116412871 [Galleria mellonella]|uniref:Uncharacterized protein LOC116412871 n=1 Tax=Galleria mellonella TaxID=7137 RepID=A0ABM3N260_GALME|nr:uncharacterized protein LOC116412871 [Galleria mellonella]